MWVKDSGPHPCKALPLVLLAAAPGSQAGHFVLPALETGKLTLREVPSGHPRSLRGWNAGLSAPGLQCPEASSLLQAQPVCQPPRALIVVGLSGTTPFPLPPDRSQLIVSAEPASGCRSNQSPSATCAVACRGPRGLGFEPGGCVPASCLCACCCLCLEHPSPRVRRVPSSLQPSSHSGPRFPSMLCSSASKFLFGVWL